MQLDSIACFLASTALAFGLFAAAFDSFFWALFLCCLYVAGLLWGGQLICLITKTLANDNPNGIEVTDNAVAATTITAKATANSCGVCGNDQCKRHRRPPHYNPVPKVPKGFDSALENLLEEILKTYVCTWYSDLSSNDAFVQQLRLAIATAATNVTNRLFKCDLSHIIFNHLIPLGVHHARDWRELKKRAKDLGGNPTDHIPDYLGSKIHPAAYSREAELNYLRGIVATLLPHLLPITHVNTNNQVILREVLANWVLLPAIDALADPDNLNMLISLCTHIDGKFSQSTDTIYVPMLHTWISNPQLPQGISNTLKPSLEQVLNDPQLLYMFMQHIKDSGLVNLLQFCLDIDDLSKRMLNPEITPELEKTLYADARSIYSTYLDSESPDFLNLPMYIAQGMKEILDLGPKNIQELRTSRPLYEAHQEAHTLLENTWLPSFHHTYQIYKFLCGEPVINTTVKTNSHNSNASNSTGGGFRLKSQLSKIRGVLKASAVEGAPFVPHQVFQAEEVNCMPRTGVAQSTSSSTSSTERDLSTWRVSVPHVDGGGAQPLYMVSVHSVSEDRSWTVLRRDQDFYALRARLSEFHGDKELNDSPLPTRKNPHPSLTANRQRYQDFLQKLLSKPTLRSSELLHAFLTVPNLKPYFSNASSTPDIGVLCQSMAHKLRKERGQHLDKFMSTFLSSTNAKSDQPDVGVELAGDHNFHESQKKGRDLIKIGPFGNNLNLDPRIQNFSHIVNKLQHTKGACFCIAEALESLLEVPPTVSKIIWVLASTVHQSVDPFVNKWFYKMIVTLLSGGRAAIVVKLLHEVIFETEDVDEGAKAEEHYRDAKDGLYNLVPWWVFGVHSKWCDLMDSLLEPIQNAAFNKHLAYLLVDQLLVNLFPEVM
ncbi:sorting nexin-14-like [Copidosoma floridanum]|uniref:sorting nexin-14-like n=1 Tax=Copidosoma floridanum TaxID=29053 RepID=UPI0006C97803|nr:sorting nexin-14-like [Copidosoma floridanum]